MEIAQAVAGLSFLAVIVEGLVEGITSTIQLNEKYSQLIKRAISLVLSLLLVFGFNMDYSGVLGFEPLYPWIGLLFTGFTAGLGSSVIHDIFDNYIRN